jgi:hypothetical protein
MKTGIAGHQKSYLKYSPRPKSVINLPAITPIIANTIYQTIFSLGVISSFHLSNLSLKGFLIFIIFIDFKLYLNILNLIDKVFLLASL